MIRQSAFRLVDSRLYHFGASLRECCWKKGREGDAPVPAAVAFHVTPETFSHVESLTVDFPKVVMSDAIMRLQWGTTGVSLNIKAPWRQP